MLSPLAWSSSTRTAADRASGCERNTRKKSSWFLAPRILGIVSPGCADMGAANRSFPLTRLASCEIVESIALMERRMAGNLHVRNLDDNLIARLKRRAARHGRSTEAEHREILRQALVGDVEPSFESLAAELRKLTKRRKQTPSEVLLREGGDER